MYIIVLVISNRRKECGGLSNLNYLYKVQEFMAFLFEARKRKDNDKKTGIDDDNAFIKYPNSFVVYFKVFH